MRRALNCGHERQVDHSLRYTGCVLPCATLGCPAGVAAEILQTSRIYPGKPKKMMRVEWMRDPLQALARRMGNPDAQDVWMDLRGVRHPTRE